MIKNSAKMVAAAAMLALPIFGASQAHAVVAPTVVETWDLFSHSDGGAAPPVYGLRLDGLYTGNSSHVWTFEFEDGNGDSTINMFRFDDGSVQIKGTVFGGKNSGSGYQTGNFGTWLVDFTYRNNVVFGDENPDVVRTTADNPNNNGFIAPLFDLALTTGVDEGATNGTTVASFGQGGTPLTIALVDEAGNHPFSFLYSNDGHRCGNDQDCLDRSVGRGWLNHATDYDGQIDPHIYASDWLFTGQVSQVPVPAALPLLATAFGLLGFVSARRARKAA